MTRHLAGLLALGLSVASIIPGQLRAEASAGAYLAARQAGYENNFDAAARYFTEALRGDPANPQILESLVIAHAGLGDFAAAAPFAKQLTDAGVQSQFGQITLDVTAALADDWASIIAARDAGHQIGPLVDGLTRAWALVGLGQMTEALTAFDDVIATSGLRSFGLYHKALALASVGDFEGADAIFAMSPAEGMQASRRSALAHAQVLSQLGRSADALAMLDALFGQNTDPALTGLRNQLTGNEAVPYRVVTDARTGMAEVYLSIASALQDDADDAYTLIYARAAEALAPANTDAILLTADLLEKIGRYEMANATYSKVAQDDPAFQAAELGRSAVLRLDGRLDAAIEVLQQLARGQPDQPVVLASLGDLLRQKEDMPGANAAYTAALDLMRDDDPAGWFVHYVRGITYERMDQWDAAEADFRASLALNPGQPSVLNYLGYSLVEHRIKLDEALAMIQQAARAEPDSGAIIDSLGWVLYRLGRYQEAVGHMERAAALEPVDPIINDHLGDVLWAVGREIEARFQWQRALSFEPEETEATRIRRKLEIGLDAVLAEEGADPLQVARDDR